VQFFFRSQYGYVEAEYAVLSSTAGCTGRNLLFAGDSALCTPPPLPPVLPPPPLPPPAPLAPWPGCTEANLRGDLDGNGQASLGDAVYVSMSRLAFGLTGRNRIQCLGGDFDSDGAFTINDAAHVAAAQFGKAHLPWDRHHRRLRRSTPQPRGNLTLVQGSSPHQLEVYLYQAGAVDARWKAISVEFINGTIASVAMTHDAHGQITVQHAGSFFHAAELGGRGLSWPMGHVATVSFSATTIMNTVRINHTSFNTYVVHNMSDTTCGPGLPCTVHPALSGYALSDESDEPSWNIYQAVTIVSITVLMTMAALTATALKKRLRKTDDPETGATS